MSEEIQKSDPEMEYWPPAEFVLPEEEAVEIRWHKGPNRSGRVFAGRLEVPRDNLIEKVASFFRVYRPDLEEWGYWKDYQVRDSAKKIIVLARKASYTFKEGMSPPPIRAFSVERTIESDQLYPVMEIFVDHPYLSIHYDYNHEEAATDLAARLVNRFAVTPREVVSPIIPAGNGHGQTEGNSEGEQRKKRNRYPSAEKLKLCGDAMEEWLDRDISLTAASDLAGVDPSTVRRWIPNVLQMIEPDKREIWTRKLKALNELR